MSTEGTFHLHFLSNGGTSDRFEAHMLRPLMAHRFFGFETADFTARAMIIGFRRYATVVSDTI
jgi:hypothetical protein